MNRKNHLKKRNLPHLLKAIVHKYINDKNYSKVKDKNYSKVKDHCLYKGKYTDELHIAYVI